MVNLYCDTDRQPKPGAFPPAPSLGYNKPSKRLLRSSDVFIKENF